MRRLLMTVDATGGVWRYAMDLARGLQAEGIETVFLGLGPEPAAHERRKAQALGILDWAPAPLDWMVSDESDLSHLPALIAERAARHGAGAIQVNVPSQAAGMPEGLPVVAFHHSCVATWFRAVRGHALPDAWSWQARLTRRGLERADAVAAPSRSHAEAVAACYPGAGRIAVVPNAVKVTETAGGDAPYVAASGRWWDDGKNGATLDAAAGRMIWPVVMTGPTRSPTSQSFTPARAVAAGPLPHDAALALTREAGIFVAPSLYEPFGLAVAEAARVSRPLVLADIPTFRELWDGAALFFPANDPDALCDAANRLIEDPVVRRRLGHAAQMRARRFITAAQARAMRRLLDGLASSQPIAGIP